MAKYQPEDLFNEKTMTFGEHLDELRVCLWKALLGIVGGLIIGLIPPINFYAIYIIRQPMDRALQRYGVSADQPPKPAGEKTKPEPETRKMKLDLRSFIPPFEELGFLDPKKTEMPDQPIWIWVEVSMEPQPALEPAKPAPPTTSFGPNIIVTGPMEAFKIYLTAALAIAVLLAGPWAFFQVWVFIAAGLYRHEKAYVYFYLPVSLALFLSGAVFCYFLVFPTVLDFLLGFNKWLNLTPMIRMADWVSFALMLPIMFGVSFQLPLVMLVLEQVGIFTTQDYRRQRRMAILVIAVASMVLTPTQDAASMLMMMIPLLFLYELGIWAAGFMRRRSPLRARVPVP